MKKIMSIVFALVFFLSACNLTEPNKIEEATVTNRSSITPINFQTNGITYSIPNTPDTSITIRLRWTDAVELLNNPRAIVSKYYDYSNGDKMKIKFVDMPVYKFTIKNNSNTNITLKEANNLLTDTYGGTVTVAALSEERDVNIYTEHPSLSVTAPENVSFKIKITGKLITVES